MLQQKNFIRLIWDTFSIVLIFDSVDSSTMDSDEGSEPKKMLIIDCRSYSAAFANRAKGGGMECPGEYMHKSSFLPLLQLFLGYMVQLTGCRFQLTKLVLFYTALLRLDWEITWYYIVIVEGWIKQQLFCSWPDHDSIS